MTNIAVITTFPNASWEVYSKQMLQSFVANWPKDVPLMVGVDDGMLQDQLAGILRPDTDAAAYGWEKDHIDFVHRNKDKDDPTNYRLQAVRFCHKVFAISHALKAMRAAKENNEPVERYLVWLDADVHTTRKVTHEDLKECLPKEGDAVSYMGRKDWDHSECGWLAFDMENGGDRLIDHVVKAYTSDIVFNMQQWHDSYIWDDAIRINGIKATNLTPNATGMEVWPQSPMGKWSVHYKGPQAKADLAMKKGMKVQQPMQMGPHKVVIQTKNSIPNEEIQAHIAKNQALIKNWVKQCLPTDEEIVVVSAGKMLIAEEVRKEVEAGKKIVAVKNALVPLSKAGIKPWCCILLDPRPHVADFIKDADPDVLWFVASQVDPAVTMELLAKGCTVWGYHASVNAGEESLTEKQGNAIVFGGSATATRGLFLLHLLGFSNFTLYGYDLCMPDKVDLNEITEIKNADGTISKNPKYMEFSVGLNDPLYNVKRCFWTEPQFIAQFEEMQAIFSGGKLKIINAYGHGLIPFIVNGSKLANLRRDELNAKMNGNLIPCDDLIGWNSNRKTNCSTPLLPRLLQTLRRPKAASSF